MFGLDFIRKLRPCKWRYVKGLDDEVEHFGFIAQDVNKIAPHDVYGFVEIGKDGYYRVRMEEFIGPIVKALQEIDERLTDLENKE